MSGTETSGGDVGYYALEIKHPKRFEPCTVECEDVIAALGLNFFEGEAFKAIWRKGAQRTLGVGKAGNTALRDAQKMAHYGARELAHEEQRTLCECVNWCPVEDLIGRNTLPAGAVGTGYDELVSTFDSADLGEWRKGDKVRGRSGRLYAFQELAGGYATVLTSGGMEYSLAPCNLTWVSRP